MLTRSPLLPGSHVQFRVLGMLQMRDGGRSDEKLIGVPVDAVDADAALLQGLDDLPPSLRQRVQDFFAQYKRDAQGSTPVSLDGWAGREQALVLLQQARERYRVQAAAAASQARP